MGKTYTKLKLIEQEISFNSLSGNKKNLFAINLNESVSHRTMKFLLCVELIRKGYSIYTEVVFKNKKRADIVCIDEDRGNAFIFEILTTETQIRFNEKLNTYPIDFEIIPIYADKPLEEQIPI